VRRLDDAGRVDELARMLGGEAITDGLLASAREMLAGRKVQAKAKGESETAGRPPAKTAGSAGPKPVPRRSR
jgi:hypothetical protein